MKNAKKISKVVKKKDTDFKWNECNDQKLRYRESHLIWGLLQAVF